MALYTKPIQFSLKTLRILHGLSMSAAAKGIGISRSTLRKCESSPNSITLFTAIKIARYYGIPMDFIFLGTDEQCAAVNRKRLEPQVKKEKTALH